MREMNVNYFLASGVHGVVILLVYSKSEGFMIKLSRIRADISLILLFTTVKYLAKVSKYLRLGILYSVALADMQLCAKPPMK